MHEGKQSPQRKRSVSANLHQYRRVTSVYTAGNEFGRRRRRVRGCPNRITGFERRHGNRSDFVTECPKNGRLRSVPAAMAYNIRVLSGIARAKRIFTEVAIFTKTSS